MTETVFFDNVADKRIFCILSRPPAKPPTMLIMSHGFTGSSIGPAREFVNFSRQLVDAGFSVLRFDQPRSGNSEGDFFDSSFNEWISTVAALTWKYQAAGYTVCLLGQSMGATASTIAAARDDLVGTIPCLLLWAPDPVLEFAGNPDTVYEENGQQHRGQFWAEAKRADFFAALDRFTGTIHLVYGERDSIISPQIRQEVITRVQEKGGSHMILPGQGHSSWESGVAQTVYDQERLVLETKCQSTG